MADNSPCPPEKVVAECAAGNLSGEELATFQNHIAACSKCREAFEWVQFHFYQVTPTGGEAPEYADTRAIVDYFEADPDKTTGELTQDRFDLGILLPTENAAALGRMGEYDVLSLIGFGGMGVVFKAFDERLRRAVAIKALNRSLATNTVARRRFIREARAAGQINHPNVVTIYSVDEHQDQPFLVMEYIGGWSLRDRLRKETRIDPISAMRIGVQIAEALDAAHAQGVIHRDVKPANIMLEDGKERVKITDFGLARVAIDNVELTSGEMAVGTPAYMAPEQVRGEKVDARTDLFGLGCVMYAMLVGHSPFHAKSSLEIVRKVADENPTPPQKLNDRVPGFLSEIVMRLLEKNPDRRFQTAREVCDGLKSHLAVLNQTPTDRLNTVLYGAGSRPKRSTIWWVVVLTVLLVVIVGGVWLVKLAVDRFSAGSSEDVAVLGLHSGSSPNANLPAIVTVALDGEADYRSINQALRRVEAGTVIKVAPGEYEEAIEIDDAQQWSGVSILAKDATLLPPEGSTAIVIRGVPHLKIEGLSIECRKNQHGFLISGNAEGLQLRDCNVHQSAGCESAAMVLTDGASGSEQAPITVQGCSIRGGWMGVTLWGKTEPIRWVRFERNKFIGPSPDVNTQLIIEHQAEDVAIRDNVFLTGLAGISLQATEDNQLQRIQIANNTFFRLRSAVKLNDTSIKQSDIRFMRNLLLETNGVSMSDSQREGMKNWWTGNVWEIRPGESNPNREEAKTFAEIVENVEVLSREVDAEVFLIPKLEIVTGAKQSVERIGAFAPQTSNGVP